MDFSKYEESTIALLQDDQDFSHQVMIDRLQDTYKSVSTLSDDKRSVIKVEFLRSLLQSINKQVKILQVCQSHETLEVIRLCVIILRSTFINCSRNQNVIVDDDDNLMSFLDNLVYIIVLNTQEIEDNATSVDVQEWLKMTKMACATCLANLVASNSHSRQRTWQHVHHRITELFNVDEQNKVSRVLCCFIHNCFLEDNLRDNFIRNEHQLKHLIKKLVELDDESAAANEFVQFTLNDLLPQEGVLQSLWTDLIPEEQMHVLSYIISIVELHDQGNSSWAKLPTSCVILYLLQVFKEDADLLLKTFTEKSAPVSPNVMNKLLCLATTAAASDSYKSHLQTDHSLLISSVYLLRAMSESNLFSRVTTTDSIEEQQHCDLHPAFGFKADLIRLIGLLSHRNKENQDIVRDINGILLVLENTQADARNPLIKENALFTLHSLLENNDDNKQVIRSLELKGVAQNQALANLGLEAKIEDNKIRIIQKGE